MNESVTEVFVEQPLASPGSAKNINTLILIFFSNARAVLIFFLNIASNSDALLCIT